MRTLLFITVLSIVISAGDARGADDFLAEAQAAYAKLQPVHQESEKLVVKGDYAAAHEKLLAVFPEKDRTAAQSFMLGNMLFELDRKRSYALHKAAAEKAPDNGPVMWEWALQQHRAKEYEGAVKAYQFYSTTSPNFAAPYALLADCLLRLNRIDEAAAAWQQSEKARSGSIEMMESLVCAVNREPMPHDRRAALLAKVTTKQDADAAADLIALDCAFADDWWNTRAKPAYLDNDLPLITAALKLPAGDARLRAMACAAQCAVADPGDGEAVKKILASHRMIVDADQTLPAHGGLFGVIWTAATSAGVLDAKAKAAIAPKVKELAKRGSDMQVWAAAAMLEDPAAGPQKQLQFARELWKATGNDQIAALVLVTRLQEGKLAGDDPELLAALKQFPGSGPVHRVNFQVAQKDKKLTREILAAAAKAEFTHFSSYLAPATVVNRPRSGYLRGYFLLLNQMAQEKKDK